MEQWREDVIAHYNHNHDKLGRFAESPGGSNRSPKQHLKAHFQSRGERKAYKGDKQRGTANMIVRQIFKDIGIGAGATLISYYLSNIGMETLSNINLYAAAGYEALDNAYTLTGIIQKNRGKYRNGN